MIGRGPEKRWFGVAAIMTAMAATAVLSKGLEAPAPENPNPALTAARHQAEDLTSTLPRPQLGARSSFDVSAESKVRLRNFLPKTFLKLSQREPVHLVFLSGQTLDVAKDAGDPEPRSLATVFANDLANQFFYTGGVREAGKSPAGHPFSPAIDLVSTQAPGPSVLDAPGLIDAAAHQGPVDLVVLCFGAAEAQNGMRPVAYAQAIEDAIDAGRSIGADVIVCGAWLPMTDSLEESWGAVRTLTSAAREAAEEASALFADLGDLSQLMQMPETGNEAVQVFDGIQRLYRGYFLETAPGVFVPRQALHSKAGHMLFDQMLAATPKDDWSFHAASATLAGTDRLILQGTLENRSKKPVSLTLLPLVAEGWRPVHVLSSVEVVAGGKQAVKIEYSLAEGADASLVESFVRLPVLVRAGPHCRIADLAAPVTPLALVWEPQTFFNQDGPFLANCRVVNNSDKEYSGVWEARLGDQNLKGSFTAKAHAAFPLDLRFDLPPNLQEPAVLPLTVTVEHEGHRVTSRRQVEFVRNIGLAETMPMHRVTKAQGETRGGVSFKPTADERRLTLSVVVADPSLLQGTPEAGPAWQLDLNLDARSYGKRLEHGATGTLRISGTAADGPATVHEIAPWAFGNGYAFAFDPKALSADLTTAADGSRIISVSIPRSYLHLHEWALDNGNSQFGLNLRLTLRQAPLGGQESLVSFTLTQNTKAPEDVDSLAVLELTEKPTKRATVNVY